MGRKPTRCDGEYHGTKFYGAGPGNGVIHPITSTQPVIVIPAELVDDCQHDNAECDLANHCKDCGAYRSRIGATRFTKWKKPKITS